MLAHALISNAYLSYTTKNQKHPYGNQLKFFTLDLKSNKGFKQGNKYIWMGKML